MHSFMLQCATTNVISLIIVTLLNITLLRYQWYRKQILYIQVRHDYHYFITIIIIFMILFKALTLLGQPQTCHLQPVTVVLDTQMGIRCYYYFALFVELYHYMRKCMMLINL